MLLKRYQTRGSVAYKAAGLFLLGGKGWLDMAGADLHFKVRIKNREQFKRVFPIPIDNNKTPAIARFILSIIGKSIWVRRISNSPDSFCYVPVDDDSFIIMPNWIEYFETDGMIPVTNRFGVIEPSDDGLDIDDVFVITG